jgi:hypothetical protein
MRFWSRLLAAIVVLACAGLAVWGYLSRESLTRQWKAYQVGRAAGNAEVCQAIAWFEAGPDQEARLRSLVAKWGTGNPRFDFFLARYVGSPESSESLRKAFSLEFAWRDGLLVRWAQYWIWRAGDRANERIDEILSYTELLDAAQQPLKEISWREILDLQAIFQIAAQPRLAERLTPANWHERFRQWRQSRPAAIPPVVKPTRPLPDWQGPIPE